MPYIQASRKEHTPKIMKSFLADDFGLPRYWITVWSLVKGKDLAESTEMARLRYIESLYSFSEQLHHVGYFDDVLTGCMIEKVGNVLEAYFISLQNRPKISEASQKQWQSGLIFVRDVILRLSKNIRNLEKLAELEKRLMRFEAQHGQLRIKKNNRPDTLRSLPAAVVEYLYEVLDPASPKNPFVKERTRWTVFQSFLLMLHQGLRRGETLLLPVNAVKSGFSNENNRNQYWINIQEIEAHRVLDHRYNRPSIKTANSIRQIPVSETIARCIQVYVENYRGKAEHPFLLNTLLGTPLSQDSLTAYFMKISSNLPCSIRKILQDRIGKDFISPHDLRHTSAVVRLSQLLKQNTPPDIALQQLRTFFGWSRTSDMPRRYARAVFEDRLSNVWGRIIDDRIAIIQSIPSGH